LSALACSNYAVAAHHVKLEVNYVEPRDLFGVVVRSLGLIITSLGLWYLAFAVAQAADVSEPIYPTITYSTSGGALALLGMVLLLGAPIVVRISYRKI
jgi:hypothetical protein